MSFFLASLNKNKHSKMATFYGRSGVRVINAPQMSGNRDEFIQNTFVQMTGAAQTIPTAIDTSLPCATVVKDNRSNITATDSITIDQTGFYLCVGKITCAGAVGGTTSLRVGFAVGGTLVAGTAVAGLAVDTLTVESVQFLSLTAAQVLSLWGQAVGADYTTANISITCMYLGPSA